MSPISNDVILIIKQNALFDVNTQDTVIRLKVSLLLYRLVVIQPLPDHLAKKHAFFIEIKFHDLQAEFLCLSETHLKLPTSLHILHFSFPYKITPTVDVTVMHVLNVNEEKSYACRRLAHKVPSSLQWCHQELSSSQLTRQSMTFLV